MPTDRSAWGSVDPATALDELRCPLSSIRSTCLGAKFARLLYFILLRHQEGCKSPTLLRTRDSGPLLSPPCQLPSARPPTSRRTPHLFKFTSSALFLAMGISSSDLLTPSRAPTGPGLASHLSLAGGCSTFLLSAFTSTLLSLAGAEDFGSSACDVRQPLSLQELRRGLAPF